MKKGIFGEKKKFDDFLICGTPAKLGEGGEEGNGLHNIAATLQMDSPEFSELSVTEMRVPIFGDMTKEQKQTFIELCGIRQ